MLGMGRAFRIALQAEAHMFKKWEAAHRELGLLFGAEAASRNSGNPVVRG